jgi:uncharacterized protein YndB with AHSA1/START domain
LFNDKKEIIRIENCRRGDILVRIKKSIEINASPEKVWEMLAFDKAVEWMEGWKSIEYTFEVHTSADKYRVGALKFNRTLCYL